MQCCKQDVNINEAHFSLATRSGSPLLLIVVLQEGIRGFISLVRFGTMSLMMPECRRKKRSCTDENCGVWLCVGSESLAIDMR